MSTFPKYILHCGCRFKCQNIIKFKMYTFFINIFLISPDLDIVFKMPLSYASEYVN